MTRRTKPASAASHAPLNPLKDQVPDAGLIVHFQDLFSLGMDRALGIETESLTAVVRLNADAMDYWVNAFRRPSLFGNFSEAAAQACASFMEFQLSLVTLMASQVSDTVGSISNMQAQLAADVLERSMDIAIGESFAASSIRTYMAPAMRMRKMPGTDRESDEMCDEMTMAARTGS